MNILDRVEQILTAEASAIASIPINDCFQIAIKHIRNCKSKLITTGMGKAGIVAQKSASTFCSTGTTACYLHPGEAAHGDLGIVSPGDVILAFSTSGKTREVIEVIKLSRQLGVYKVIVVTSHSESDLRELADVVIDMGIIDEPCPLGLTPSASTAAMMAIGDVLALCAMEMNNLTKEEYGLRHHGGYLGKIARD